MSDTKDAPRDDNRVPAALAVDSTDNTKVQPIQINPTTGALQCEAV